MLLKMGGSRIQNNLSEINKDGSLLFPTHGTINLTIDSSPWLFGAYRELAAQAARNLVINNNSLINKSTEINQQETAFSAHDMKIEAKRLTKNIKLYDEKKHPETLLLPDQR
ncbi:MAG: hypothetical protein K2Q11_02570 [Burkholderiaceae bacterium]|nr:hypothetical protein [Burkholderiaceae bacterium]